MFIPLGTLLKTYHRRSKTSDAIRAIQVRQAFGEALRKTCDDLPGDILGSVKAVSFKNGVLTCKTPGLVRVELQMRASGLRDEINKQLGRAIVNRLRFRTN